MKLHSMAKTQGSAGRRRAGSEDRTVTPLYHQVYVVLREKIRANEYGTNEPMPGEHQLAEEFGVSRVTIRRTLQNLELDGLIERRRGVGTFAVPRPVELRDRYNIGGLLEPGSLSGAAVKVRTLSFRTIDSPAHIARQFSDEQPVVRIERVRTIKRTPFTRLTIYLPVTVAEKIDRDVLKRTAALTALESAGFYLARTEQSISARVADDVAASLLKVPIGTPLISMSAFFSGRGDEPLVVMEGLFRPDLYEYRTTAIRRGTGKNAHWKQLL